MNLAPAEQNIQYLQHFGSVFFDFLEQNFKIE